MSNKLSQISKKMAPIFKQYGVIRADVFGSQARGNSKTNSDVDLAVTLKKPLGLFKFNELNDKLESRLHVKVDLLTHQSINKHLKPFIVKDMVRIYEAKQ